MKKLSNDVSRCHDSTCPFRLECARYLQRNASRGGSARGPVVSMHTMWPIGEDTCPFFIPQNDGDAIADWIEEQK